MDYALPIGFALFLWWFTTGAIFYLDQLAQWTFKWSMLGATAVLAAALHLIWARAEDTSLWAVYAGFTAGLLAWGWQEISLYTGFVTGPRKVCCEKGCSGWAHFGHAIQVNLWHEIAIIAVALVIVALSWGAANQWGLWTYLLLWSLHLSARLNVFLGVRNVSAQFLPPHMEVLKSFLTVKPMNLLFPVSVTVTTIASVLLLQQAYGATSVEARTGFALLGALAVLGVAEHWLLILPLPVEKIWQWSIPRDRKPRAKKASVSPPLEYAPLKTELLP